VGRELRLKIRLSALEENLKRGRHREDLLRGLYHKTGVSGEKKVPAKAWGVGSQMKKENPAERSFLKRGESTQQGRQRPYKKNFGNVHQCLEGGGAEKGLSGGGETVG